MTTATALAAPASTDEYVTLVATCHEAAARYYGYGDSALDDTTYDQYAAWIEAWEQLHPGEVHPDSPTGKVGGGAAPAGNVAHTTPMLSLAKSHSRGDVEKWDASLRRRAAKAGVEFTGGYAVEVKLDGLAYAARYADGRLVQVLLRGDHAAGEDVSHLIGKIEGLPLQLAQPLTLEARGECLMTATQFEEANKLRRQHGDDPFSNPRNAAAGSARAQNRAYEVGLTSYTYALILDDETAAAYGTHHDVMELAEVDGLAAAYSAGIAAHLAQIGPVIDKLAAAGVAMGTAANSQAQDGNGAAAAAGPLAGQIVVVTGGMGQALAGRSRGQVNELIDAAGGKASGNVSSKTTLLVAGTNAGSKLTKARDLGITVVTEEEFGELVAAYLD